MLQIIDEVFETYSHKLVEKRTQATYRKRAFCVQYRETDLAFVHRLMEEEGIYYHFEHSLGQHKLILCDGPSAHHELRGGKLVWADGKGGGRMVQNLISSWARSTAIRPLKYTHTDYDFEIPTASLLTTSSRQADHGDQGGLDLFEYPGESDDLAQAADTGTHKSEGEHLAKMRIRRFEAQHDRAIATSPCRGLMSGLSFTLAGHPDAGEYLITGVEFRFKFGAYESGQSSGHAPGQEDPEEEWGYESTLHVVPKSTPYLPPALTPRPLISGPQTATVVGPSGDEIHTDKHGRVKLQFRWDRLGKKDADSSCWVRVSHPWAGKQFGMIALPRIGDEVVVEFLDGNPDRPLITGRVYNADNMPPWELPTHATASGIKTHATKEGGADNHNELRFEDDKGKEHIWFQAEKDFHRLVKNNHFDTIKNDSVTQILKNESRKIGETLTLAVGKVSTIKLDGDVHATLGADLNIAVTGATSLKIDDKLSVKTAAATQVSVGAGLDIKATGATNLEAGGSVHNKGLGIVIDGGTQLCIKAGGSYITLGPEGVSIQGTIVKNNSGGSAGSANSAAAASPTAPKAPAEPAENKDPFAS